MDDINEKEKEEDFDNNFLPSTFSPTLREERKNGGEEGEERIKMLSRD